MFSQKRLEQKPPIISDGSNEETDSKEIVDSAKAVDSDEEVDKVKVIFDEELFPTFTVKVVTTEEQQQEVVQSNICHCSEQALVGSIEVQEWKVELDSDEEHRRSSTSDEGSVGSPDSTTDQHTLVMSPDVPPIDSVTRYSLESTNVVVSYTFELHSSQY